MKKLLILFLLFILGCSTSQILYEEKECQELSNKFAEEQSKLDYSCVKDEECTYSLIGCSCKNINTNEIKLEEIRNQEIDFDCKPQIECIPFKCICKDNRCNYKEIPREEWGY